MFNTDQELSRQEKEDFEKCQQNAPKCEAILAIVFLAILAILLYLVVTS